MWFAGVAVEDVASVAVSVVSLATARVGWGTGEILVATAPDPDDRNRMDERVFLIEAGHVIEGPGGWERGDARPRGKSVIWREIPSEARPEGRIGR